MITQTIKGWLQKVFAWWPWKQSPPVKYRHVASAVSRGSAPETSLWIPEEGTVPQAGATPRRLSFENRPDRPGRAESPDLSPLSAPASFPPAGADSAENCAQDAQPSPNSRQRLEFLRYLVQRGIVNEGFENDHPG